MASSSKKSEVECGRYKGKVAVVTGSTVGIGYSVARRLGQEGAKLVINSRKQHNVDEAVKALQAEGIECFGMVCNVGKEDDRKRLVEETVKRYGGVDVFVSNAAVSPHFGMPLSISEAQWDKIFSINLKAPFFLTQEIMPHMRKGGAICYIASIGGYKPFGLIGPYSVSKTALIGLTKAVADECFGSGIRVNCLCPGVIQTRFSSALWEDEAAREQAEAGIPMGRLGQPEECAGAVAFMCSDDASYMTGQSMVVAGGMHARL